MQLELAVELLWNTSCELNPDFPFASHDAPFSGHVRLDHFSTEIAEAVQYLEEIKLLDECPYGMQV